METAGLRDHLGQEETGKDCQGKVRYWLLSCYTCRRRCTSGLCCSWTAAKAACCAHGALPRDAEGISCCT